MLALLSHLARLHGVTNPSELQAVAQLLDPAARTAVDVLRRAVNFQNVALRVVEISVHAVIGQIAAAVAGELPPQTVPGAIAASISGFVVNGGEPENCSPQGCSPNCL